MLEIEEKVMIKNEMKWFNQFLNQKGYFVCKTGSGKRALSEEFSFVPDEDLLSLIKEYLNWR
jgi:hypothetical protein